MGLTLAQVPSRLSGEVKEGLLALVDGPEKRSLWRNSSQRVGDLREPGLEPEPSDRLFDPAV